jgi:hypothetical protein
VGGGERMSIIIRKVNFCVWVVVVGFDYGFGFGVVFVVIIFGRGGVDLMLRVFSGR